MGTAVTLTKDVPPGVLTADRTPTLVWAPAKQNSSKGGGLAGDKRTMGTAKGHIKAHSYRKLTSSVPGIQLPSPWPSHQPVSSPFVPLHLFPSRTCLFLSR